MENIFKGKEAFLKYKLELLQTQPEEVHDVIENEINNIDDILSQSIDSQLQSILNETFSTNSLN